MLDSWKRQVWRLEAGETELARLVAILQKGSKQTPNQSNGNSTEAEDSQLCVSMDLQWFALDTEPPSGHVSEEEEDAQPQKLGNERKARVLVANMHLAQGDFQVADRLEKAEQRFRQVIDLMPDWVFSKDSNGRWLFANASCAAGLGTTPEALVTQHHLELHDRDAETVKMLKDDKDVFDSGCPKLIPEEQYTGRQGISRWFRTTKVPYVTVDTNTQAVLGVGTDITCMRSLMSQLKRSEARYRALFNMSGVATLIVKTESTAIAFASQGTCRLLGFSEENIVSRPVMQLMHPEDAPAFKAAYHQACQEHNSDQIQAEVRCVRMDGSSVWTRISISLCMKEEVEALIDPTSSPQSLDDIINSVQSGQEGSPSTLPTASPPVGNFDAGSGEGRAPGVPGYVQCVLEDISSLRQEKEDAAKVTKRLRDMVENLPVGAVQVIWQGPDEDDAEIFFNRAVEDITGFSRQEVRTLGQWWDSIYRGHPEKAKASYYSCRKRSFAVPDIQEVARKDGVVRWFEFGAYSYGEGEVWMVSDVTDKLLAQEKFRVLFEMSSDPHFLCSTEGVIQDCNQSALSILGFTKKSEVVGQRASQLAMESQENGVQAESLHQQKQSEAQATGSSTFKWNCRRKDGTVIPVEVILTHTRMLNHMVVLMVWHDLTERRRAHEQLLKAKEDAEEASRAKSQFLSQMSHEMRTPLSGVIGVADLLRMTDLTNDQRKYVDTMKSSGEMLLTLINDILDLSKIETKKLELEAIDFDLRKEVKDSLALLDVKVEEKGLSMVCTIDEALPRIVQGDPTRLRQILLNLVSNAIKFTAKGSIKVSVKLAEEGLLIDVPPTDVIPEAGSDTCSVMLQFEVADTGVGVPQEARGRLFKAFMQADSSTSRKFGGTGLGLCICQCLVTNMGGKIWSESEVGKGSTFFFTVKFGVRNPGAENAPNVSIVRTSSGREMYEDIQAEISSAVREVSFSNLHILVAEDNKVNQMVATTMLRMLGCEFDLAENGVQAVQACKERRYDVVLMDCHMPELDGFEATSRIREMESQQLQTPHSVIIALTASALKENEERCRACGMDDFISKPVRLTDMKAAIARNMRGRQRKVSPSSKVPISPKPSSRFRREAEPRFLAPLDMDLVIETSENVNVEREGDLCSHVHVEENGRDDSSRWSSIGNGTAVHDLSSRVSYD